MERDLQEGEGRMRAVDRGEWRREVETGKAISDRRREKINDPVSVPVSSQTSGIKRRAT